MAKQHSPAWSCKATINQLLIDLQPKTIEEIIDHIKRSEQRQVEKDFVQIILEGDPDLFQETKDGKWQLNLKNFPAHLKAFEILNETPKALTLLQLTKKVSASMPKQQRNQIVLNFELDDRFQQIGNKKWTLSDKVNIADKAYEYLKTAEESVTEKKLIRIISNQLNIDPSKALFDPVSFSDRRFYRDTKDRWFLTEKKVQIPDKVQVEEKPKRHKLETVTIPEAKIIEIEALFDDEMQIISNTDILFDVFELKPDDDDYEMMEMSITKVLKKTPNFQPVSVNDDEWTIERFIPEQVKNLPHYKIGKHIRVTTWLEYGDDDYMTDSGFAEDEMLLEASVDERKGVLSENMQIERILSAYEYENGILFIRPCDRPFFPEKPQYLKCQFFDELNQSYTIFVNNRLGYLYGLKEWYNSIDNPFAARFNIYGTPEKNEYRLLYKRETDAFHQIPKEQLNNLKLLWERVKTAGMKTTEIILEIMRMHTHGIDRKRLYWEVNAIRYTPMRTVYGILSYFQCFEKKKGSDRWYLNTKLISKGPDPERAEFLEKRTKPRIGEWLMSPKGEEKFAKIIAGFTDWEGREAYFAFHERTQNVAKEHVRRLIARKVNSDNDLERFYNDVTTLFNAINWRKNDPDSGCWNLVLFNTDKWGIFHSVDAANHFIDLLRMFLETEDAELLDIVLEKFINLSIRGIQSSTLSPLLFCLQPSKYAVINKSTALGFERITGFPLSTDLADYMEINAMMREFLAQYELFDFSDVDSFFSHCISGRLELESYDDLMTIPPIKKAMELLMDEEELSPAEPEVKEPEKKAKKGKEEDTTPKIDSALKDEINNLAHKLFNTEELQSDLARQLMEIRIQAIWQSGNLAENFENFLESNYSLPQENRFLTPAEVIKAMVKLINPGLHEKIVDLCMGYGGYLVEVGKMFQRQFENVELTELENTAIKISLATGESMVFARNQIQGDLELKKKEGRKRVFDLIISQNLNGVEIDPVAFETGRLNLKLNNFTNANIIQGDPLSKKTSITGAGANIIDCAIGTPSPVPGLAKKIIKDYLRILKPNGRLVVLIANDEIGENRLASWKREIFKDAPIQAMFRLPGWDEDKYGPSATILLARKNAEKANPFQAKLKNLDELDETVEEYLKQ